MKIRMVTSAAIISLALSGCNGGGAGNNQMAANNAQATGLPTPPVRPAPTTGTNPTSGTSPLQIDQTQLTNACISPEDQRRPLSEISAEQRRTVVACINAAAVEQVRAQLPLQVDEATRLDRITTQGTLVTYFYTITADTTTLPPDLPQRLQGLARNNVCGQPNMRQTIQMGGAYAYQWADRNGRRIGEARVDAC